MRQKYTSTKLLHKLGGYYLIPHELLHVLAYRMIGKPCQYRWGDHQVHSLAKKSRREKLFVLLFPFTVCWILGLFFHFVWAILVISARMAPELYFSQGPKWHLIFPITATFFIIYSGTAHQDLIDAYAWLFKYKAHYDNDDPSDHTK